MDRTPMRTALRWLGRALAGFLALVVLGYLARGLWGTWQVHEAKGDARSTVAQLQRDSGDVEKRAEEVTDALGEPLHSWSQVTCTMRSHDSGWIVDEYYQSCARETVAVYPAADLHRAEPLADPDQRVDVEDWSDMAWAPRPLPATSTTSGFGSTAATPPQWSSRGDLDDEAYTVVTVSGPEAETTLGCSPWGILFCTEPVDHPVIPE